MNTKTVFSLLVSVLSLVATTGRAAPSPNAEPRQELAWKYEYDEGDRLVKTVDPAGRATQLQYSFYDTNRLRKLVRTGDDGASVTREFDETGRLTRMTDGAGIVSYTYDDRGRLNRIARQGTHAIAYTYDTLDRITSLQVGDFYRIDYAYDFLGRLASMKTPAGLVTYDYQTGLGQVVRSLPNGVKTFWKRQPNGELEEITHGFFKNRDDRKYSVLAQYAYTHGPDGKITAIRERSGQGEFTRHYAYDNMGRLVSATGPGGKAYGYAYDLVGNRVKATATGRPDQVCTYDWAGRLTSVDGKPCAYDACGNLTEATLDGVDRQYRYQPDGRLAEARIGGEAVLYLYDGFGRLVTRKTTVGETWCIPDPLSPYWQPLVMQETDGRRTLVIWDGSSPLALVREGKAEWLLHDFLGSVRVVTEANGTMTRYCEYDPCGMGESKEQNSLPLAPGFTGLLWDSHAYCYLALARTFNPRTGSFLEPDPQKRMPTPSAEDHSLYLYCSGDPLNLVDMDGAESREPVSFDSHERWMDAFERAWWYNTVGAPIRWLYRLGGGRPTGLAVNLDPNERDYMISAVISEAKKRVGENPGALHALLKEWRENLSLRPEQFRRTTVTAHEWKVLENAAYRDVLSSRTTRDVLINDGHIPALIANSVTRDGSRAPDLLIKAGTLKWEVSHGIGELTGLPPSFFDKRTEGPWLTTTPATKKAYEYGLSHWAQGNVDVRREPNPSPVGGVYLGGAGGAVAGLGPLKGIRTDANGNLVLVSEEGGDVKLPPLRLDDVVTVFRSVYLHGEGPTVTIDPNPDDPEKSAMIIVHSEATKDTYVGWVLYEADRLMKGYTLGVDNITTNNVVSQVPGYREVVDTIYFGGEDPRKGQKEGVWERFWIVPAEANRFEGARRELTLFDVPLKVKTQKMKWERNKLVDDLTGKSSPGAQAFTSWFTRNYEGISAEQYLLPPAETGLTKPVPVFAELRRIALMTAIAEKLRDQGVPMPFWMRDYEVKPVLFEKTTPAMEVTRSNDRVQARIFGGVELSPESQAVRTYTTAADAAKAPPEKRAEVDRTFKLAEHLEQAVAERASPMDSAPLTLYRVEQDNRAFQLVSVPGAKTLVLNPCRLEGVDLVLPLAGGRDIRLVRSFNSFFNPKGQWGRGWTMDLPRLQEVQIPGSRVGSKVTYKVAYELLTPLNSLYARFKDIRPVMELRGSKLQVPDAEGPFHGLADERPDFLKNMETHVLLLKDGREWHFSKQGDLIAIKDGPQITVYERGSDGRVSRIVGLVDGALAGRIDLEYTGQGNLAKAVGKSLDNPKEKALEVSYAYDASGRLAGVTSTDGTLSYGYKDSWVASVTWADKTGNAKPETLHTFDYNERGQVVSERRGPRTMRRSIAAVPGGVEASVAQAQDGGGGMLARYDTQMRPVEVKDADGTHTAWAYRPDGGIETTVITLDNQKVTVTDSANGRQRTVNAVGSPSLAAQFDVGGNLTSLAENQRVLLSQQWRGDGQLSKVETEAQGVSCRYSEHGLLSSILVHPPKAGDKFTEWQETRVDRRGSPVEVKDCTGLHLQFGYDDSGALASAVQTTPGGNVGYNVKRDGEGRVHSIKSSWGDASYTYTSSGDLARIASARGGQSASVELAAGLVRKLVSFDGGITEIDYHDQGSLAGAPRGVKCANGLKLAHEYDPDGRLKAVAVGSDRRVRLAYDAKGRVAMYAWESLAVPTR